MIVLRALKKVRTRASRWFGSFAMKSLPASSWPGRAFNHRAQVAAPRALSRFDLIKGGCLLKFTFRSTCCIVAILLAQLLNAWVALSKIRQQ